MRKLWPNLEIESGRSFIYDWASWLTEMKNKALDRRGQQALSGFQSYLQRDDFDYEW